MKNVVILGAGYAGLTTLKGLKKAAKAGEVKVTLVNKNSYHYDTVNLHEVSAGNIPAKDICIDIKDLVIVVGGSIDSSVGYGVGVVTHTGYDFGRGFVDGFRG